LKVAICDYLRYRSPEIPSEGNEQTGVFPLASTVEPEKFVTGTDLD
jgi:hypothetical protein